MRKTLLRLGAHWHRRLAIAGGIILLAFVVSGATHMLMTWSGPQPAQFFAPSFQLPAAYAANVSAIVRKHAITQASIVKIVAGEQGPLLQVTTDAADSRRYFDLQTLDELIDHDQHQATWLARHYTGRRAADHNADIAAVTLQVRFDNDYPWVNRLLPVYRVQFAGDDNLTAYIHTETATLAALSNDYKATLQAIFGVLHTWNFLDDVELLRVALISVALLLALVLMTCGIVLIFAIRQRRINDVRRRWHRRAAIAVWLPLLLFTLSGLYHLYQSALFANSRGLRAAPIMAFDALQTLGELRALLAQADANMTDAVSLLRGPDARLYYRVTAAAGSGAVSREQRFAGMPQSRDGVFFDAHSGTPAALDDERLSRFYAARFFGIDSAALAAGHKITRFGMDYDFRNKRLPVWQFVHRGSVVFVDPATATIVDVVAPALRYEAWSFSILHKWNLLTPVLGRGGRDLLLAATLGVVLLLAGLGLAQARTRR